MQENEFPPKFIDMIKKMENANPSKGGGFDEKTKLWKPHESYEPHESYKPGAKTIGYGHKIKQGETHLEKTPQTTAQIERVLMKDLVEHARYAKEAYNKHIRTTYDTKAQNPFDALDQQSKLLLIEKQFNHGNISKWPKMLKHIYNKNLEKALIEARGKKTDKNGKTEWDDNRNNLREKYFKEQNGNVGGVDLHVSNEMLSSINQELSKHGSIVGISFNELKNSIVLLTESAKEKNNIATVNIKGLSIEHLAVALLITYCTNNQYEPSFSLDPWEPTNPSGPYMRKVYYPDEFLHEQLLQGTEFGEIMFEADWILKQLSLGLSVEQIDPTLITKPMVYPNNLRETYGVKSLPEISIEQGYNRNEVNNRWHRLWIVNEAILSTESSTEDQKITAGSCLIFGNIKMNVKAKHMIINSQNGQLEDAPDTDQRTGAHQFAENMGNNYDFVADHFPVLKQLKELTKCVALAKWLYLHNVPIDIDWLKDLLSKSRMTYPNKVPSLTHTTKTSVGNSIHTQTSFGGVTLKISINPSVVNSQIYTDIQQQLNQKQLVINLNSIIIRTLAIQLPFNYAKRKSCCICQSILSWKELQLWHLALNPNYAQITENYNLRKSNPRCLLHNPLVCRECLNPIIESGPFFQDQTGSYHADCKICYECRKPLIGPHVLQNDLSYHRECIKHVQSSSSYQSNTTVNLYDDDSQKAMQLSLEDKHQTTVTKNETEDLQLALAISLSAQEVKPLHFEYPSHSSTELESYDEQLAILLNSNLNPVPAVRNKTCTTCTYINRSNANKCELCSTNL